MRNGILVTMAMTMLLIASVASFSPQTPFKAKSLIHQSLPPLSPVFPSKTSRLPVSVSSAVASDVEVENMLGSNGVYHLTTQEEHQ